MPQNNQPAPLRAKPNNRFDNATVRSMEGADSAAYSRRAKEWRWTHRKALNEAFQAAYAEREADMLAARDEIAGLSRQIDAIAGALPFIDGPLISDIATGKVRTLLADWAEREAERRVAAEVGGWWERKTSEAA